MRKPLFKRLYRFRAGNRRLWSMEKSGFAY
jgi:hypothetical protein